MRELKGVIMAKFLNTSEYQCDHAYKLVIACNGLLHKCDILISFV